MTETEAKRRWVWMSDAQSVKDATPSVLAVVETIAASGLGVWLWLHWGLYPLLLSSLVMAFLTMLRSDASVALGRDWFMVYEECLTAKKKLTTGMVALGAVLIAGGAVYLLATVWLAAFSGWVLFLNTATLGLLALFIGIAVAATVAVAVSGAMAGAMARALVEGEPRQGMIVGLAIALFPELLFGFVLRAIVTRTAVTIRHIPDGMPLFPKNWSTLVTAIDVRTEPELIPDLPKDSRFRIDSLKPMYRSGPAAERVLAALIIIILFGPTWLFRLTLKSTFLLYWPLLFVASAPKAYRAADGHLIWDDAWGRRVIDWIAVLLAVAALIAIGSTIYDPSFFASFVQWADPRNLPAHVLLQAISFKVWQLDLWEWFATLASAITVIVFLWANALNIRHRGRDRQPRWAVLKAIYTLNRLKALFVAATILASVFAMVWFVHDTCTWPDWVTDWLTNVLGPPQACVSSG